MQHFGLGVGKSYLGVPTEADVLLLRAIDCIAPLN